LDNSYINVGENSKMKILTNTIGENMSDHNKLQLLEYRVGTKILNDLGIKYEPNVKTSERRDYSSLDKEVLALIDTINAELRISNKQDIYEKLIECFSTIGEMFPFPSKNIDQLDCYKETLDLIKKNKA
jgi:hypothetical protein